MKALSATELANLRTFVREVLTVCEYDDTGVTNDLYDLGLTAAEILGIVWSAVPGDDDE